MSDFSYWLVPAEPIRTEFRKIVERLAKRYNAAPFEPHVTVYSGRSEEEKVRRSVETIVDLFGPTSLVARSLTFSPVLSKTLFIQFEPSSTLQSISDKIKASCQGQANYRLDPHMSLLYQFLPDAVLSELQKEISIPKGRYQFDTVQVMELEGPTTTVDAVKRWKYVHRATLRDRV